MDTPYLPPELVDIIVGYATLPKPGKPTTVLRERGVQIVDVFILNGYTYVVDSDGWICHADTTSGVQYISYHVDDDAVVLTKRKMFLTNAPEDDGTFHEISDSAKYALGTNHIYGSWGNDIYTDGIHRTPYTITEILPHVYEISETTDDTYYNMLYTTSPLVLIEYRDDEATVTAVKSTRFGITIKTYELDSDNDIVSHNIIHYPNQYGRILRVTRDYTVYRGGDGVCVGPSIVTSS